MSFRDVRTPANRRVLNQRNAGAAYNEICPRFLVIPASIPSMKLNGSRPCAGLEGKNRWNKPIGVDSRTGRWPGPDGSAR